MSKKINIAIDGPSASGKGVTAKGLAGILNYNYLDTGAMYRAIGFYMFENNISLENFNNNILLDINIDFDENNHVLLNGVDIDNEIRNSHISMLASNFSKLGSIRKFLVEKQKEIVKNKGYIADGRDIGSVVIPDAEVKIYLTADIDIRARRRYLEMLEKGEKDILEEDVKQDLIKRDKQDIQREESPLIKVDDAIEVDTTNLDIEGQVDKIFNIVKGKIKK